MEHLCPKDDEIAAFIGRKIKINRADEEFIGTVTGWAAGKDGKRWIIEADNASMTFLPSEGWEVYDLEVDS